MGNRLIIVVMFLLQVWCVPARGETGQQVSGVVKDGQGGAIAGAEVILANAQQVMLGSTRTDGQGRFEFQKVPSGSYLLRVAAPGFAENRLAVRVRDAAVTNLVVTLALGTIREEVTVTADPGQVADADRLSQQVNVIGQEEIAERAKAAVSQVAQEEVGVHVQRTSPTVAGIYVRGLTGNKVNVFVDGVRYSTSAARGGINTFLDLIDPASLEAVEILRGPSSAQYGSDALGGSVQFLSKNPVYVDGGPAVRGSFSTFGDSADASIGSSVTTSYATRRFGFIGGVTGRRVNTLRTGDGVDSHSAFTRYFGLASRLFQGERRPDTAFTQYGGMVKLNWSPAQGSQFTAHYSRSQQDGGKRPDQLLGGDGNMVADLRNLMLDFFYLRFVQQKLGWFDVASLSYSLNSQREERVNQGGNGNPLATISHEYERLRAHGVQAYLGKQWVARQTLLFGADFYHERLRSPSFGFNPVTGVSAVRRGRIPDRALYKSSGMYAEDIIDVVPQKFRLMGSVRYSAASYRARAADSPIVNEQPLWPNDSLRVSNVTFQSGVVVTPGGGLILGANFSRGFRAPHMTDLGALGLMGSGFEVSAPEVAGLGATIGSTAGVGALSTGRPVRQVGPETSMNYEVSVRFRRGRIDTDFAFFVNDISDNITKQALILPAGAVGLTIGGETIVAQNANGVVFVAASPNPVLVRANFDDARVRGVEHKLNWHVTSHWSVGTVFTYLCARDKRTGLPPNIEGGTPALDGWLKIRYSPGSGRWWIEPYVHAAGRQTRLSSLDLEDRRTGALRTRSSIASFFRNGATARGFVGRGTDGMTGTADDILLVTGETLAQIQDRVLGVGVNSSSLSRAVPGYVTFNLRGGVRFGERYELMADFENIGDKNYRGISWGLDAPGRSLFLRFKAKF